MQTNLLSAFKSELLSPHIIEDLRAGLIGEDLIFKSSHGEQRLIYADYSASGRSLQQVEDFVLQNVLPYYANTHSEASFCGGVMTRMREAARMNIQRLTRAGDNCSVIFCGNGATAGLNKVVMGLQLKQRVLQGEQVVVLVGPYEHHANILPWRETGAKIIEVPEAMNGGPDINSLDATLADVDGADLVIGSFSAASNVTGILTDTDLVTARLKNAGAISVWDYAAAAPYIQIDMGKDDTAKDVIVFSPHKFPGGPGASGILILRHGMDWPDVPTQPGGGTVKFVSPWGHSYSSDLVTREEAGTPNVVGDIRVALALLVKDAVGCDVISKRDEEMRKQALAAWSAIPELEILGQRSGSKALPVFSFRVRDTADGYVHHQLFARMLSDMYGIQSRAGCACAGPYAHRLLNLDQNASDEMSARIQSGFELDRLGWIRLNFSYLHSYTLVQKIIDSVAELAVAAPRFTAGYVADTARAVFAPKEQAGVIR
ncbi:MAG: aminotransferase class V-fold PLP-dependent enzyme [Yoonia sp.]|uniref:aminotransferase class V-fold PLP-dependent enzyme n=1 Tax=Yoonia sp. TaxID=2212373 RepID=UPI003EF571BB